MKGVFVRLFIFHKNKKTSENIDLLVFGFLSQTDGMSYVLRPYQSLSIVETLVFQSLLKISTN